uniref:Uncharacterized protein n=1 Tax=Anguilla anguilla TaxID=7936 RepID=A0A0E9S8W6_ANGAN
MLLNMLFQKNTARELVTLSLRIIFLIHWLVALTLIKGHSASI